MAKKANKKANKKAAKKAGVKKVGAGARKAAAKKFVKKKAVKKKAAARPTVTKTVKKSTKKTARKKATTSTHPRRVQLDHPLVKRLRELCMALPEVYEKEAWGESTFRVEGGTMFAMTDFNHHGSGHIATWVKAPPLAQGDLIEKDPGRYFAPPYMGPKGWVGIRLESGVDWTEVSAILEAGHWMSLPAKLRRALEKEKGS